MGRRRKLYDRIVEGQSDKNIQFSQARALLLHLGFKERNKGTSHYKFVREGIEELINLQETEGGKCIAYQVKQVRAVLLKYNLRKEL